MNNFLTEENGTFLVNFIEKTYSDIEKAVKYDRNTRETTEDFYNEKEKLLNYVKSSFPMKTE